MSEQPERPTPPSTDSPPGFWEQADKIMRDAKPILFHVDRYGQGSLHSAAAISAPNGVWNTLFNGKKVSTGLGQVPASEGSIAFIRPGYEKLITEQLTAFHTGQRPPILSEDQLRPQADNVPKKLPNDTYV